MGSWKKRLLWLAAILASLLISWFSVEWYIRRPPRIPAASFLPDVHCAQVRIERFEENLEGLAVRRGEKNAEALIRAWLEAFGAWPLEDDENETMSEAKLRAGLDAAHQFLGWESNLFAGEWNDGKADTLPGVVIVTHADTLLKWQGGGFAKLALGDEAISTEEYAGSKIYSREGDGEAARLSLVNLEGWLVLILEPSEGRLAQVVVDRAAAALAKESKPTATSRSALHDSSDEPAFVSINLVPQELPKLEAAFFPDAQEDEKRSRKKRKKKDEEGTPAEEFARAMEGIEQVRLTIGQTFISDFSDIAQLVRDNLQELISDADFLTLDLKGPRIGDGSEIFAKATEAPIAPLDSPTTPSATLSPPILQMDFSSAFARGGSDMLGLDWDQLIDDARDFDWVRPELIDAFGDLLGEGANGTGSANERMGFALYPTLAETIPCAAVWENRGMPRRFLHSPADAWRMTASDHPADLFSLLGAGQYTSALPPASLEAKRRLADMLWIQSEAPPLAFIAVNFDELVESMHAFPAIVLKGDDRDSWIEWRDLAESLQKTVGAFALRADRDKETIRIRLRGLDGQWVQK